MVLLLWTTQTMFWATTASPGHNKSFVAIEFNIHRSTLWEKSFTFRQDNAGTKSGPSSGRCVTIAVVVVDVVGGADGISKINDDCFSLDAVAWSLSYVIHSSPSFSRVGHVRWTWCWSNRWGMNIEPATQPNATNPSHYQATIASKLITNNSLSIGIHSVHRILPWRIRLTARANQRVLQWGHWRTVRSTCNPHGFGTGNYGLCPRRTIRTTIPTRQLRFWTVGWVFDSSSSWLL